MLNGYERANKEVIPAVRLIIARELKEHYNMTEAEIAKRLGVAQAAVSKYLNSKHSEKIGVLAGRIDRKEVSKHMEGIAKGEANSVNRCLCTVCKKVNGFDCQFSYAGKI